MDDFLFGHGRQQRRMAAPLLRAFSSQNDHSLAPHSRGYNPPIELLKA